MSEPFRLSGKLSKVANAPSEGGGSRDAPDAPFELFAQPHGRGLSPTQSAIVQLAEQVEVAVEVAAGIFADVEISLGKTLFTRSQIRLRSSLDEKRDEFLRLFPLLAAAQIKFARLLPQAFGIGGPEDVLLLLRVFTG